MQYSPNMASRLRIQRQHHPNDKEFRVEVTLRHNAVSGNDVTEILQTSHRQTNQIQSGFNKVLKLGLDWDEIRLRYGNTPPLFHMKCTLWLPQLPASASHMLGCCGSLTSFNEREQATLLLLQSALQTHL